MVCDETETKLILLCYKDFDTVWLIWLLVVVMTYEKVELMAFSGQVKRIN